MVKVLAVFMLLTSLTFAEESKTATDSLIEDMGVIDRKVICIPSLELRSVKRKVTKRLREYKVQSFNPKKPLELRSAYKRKNYERFVLIQDNTLVDPRSVLITLAGDSRYSETVNLLFRKVKKARGLLATQCALSPIWVGTAPIGVIASFLGFGAGIKSNLDLSMEKWKKLVEIHNGLIEQGSTAVVKDADSRKINNFIMAEQRFCFGPGYGFTIIPSSATLPSSFRYGSTTYNFTCTPKRFSIRTLSLKIGGRNGNLFIGCKPVWGMSTTKTRSSYEFDAVPQGSNLSLARVKVHFDNIWSFIAGGYVCGNYRIKIIENYLTLNPGMNLGFMWSECSLKSDGYIISGDSKHKVQAVPENNNGFPGYLYYNFGGPEIGATGKLGPLVLSVEYLCNMGTEYMDRFVTTHTFSTYLMLEL